ncbi:MAG: hypothetical protein A4E19_15720 [Nitrospira sp. SG-bin1]|nr:MAG: hypothetical protein A4E19_15720 [Nitrospira sp. SG-bin1]
MLLPATPNPLSPAPESSISVPVYVDLSPFLTAANDEVPKKFDHWGSFIKHPKGAEYKYYAERDDFTMAPTGVHRVNDTNSGVMLRDWWKGVELPGSQLFVVTGLRYKIGAHSLHCGDGNEWPRRATLHGNIATELTPTYGLTASVASVAVNTIDPCKITIADTDVTQELTHRLADIARAGLGRAVDRINALTVKAHVEDAWNTLRSPIPLEPDAWLQFNTDKVRHSGFSGVGPIVEDTIQVTAKPIIVFGQEPPAAVAALPPLDTPPTSTGFHGAADARLYGTLPTTLANRLTPTKFHVVTDIPMDYASLSKTLANRLTGKTVAKKGYFLLITNAAIFGNGGNQVVMRIDFSGDAIGHVYFVGKPEMNSLTQTVSFGGLRYDFATEALLQKTVDWLDLSTFRDLIASESILGVTAATDRVRGLLATTLNRALSPSVSMHGTVESVQGIGVFADTKALHIRTMSDGTLGLTVAGKP